MKKNISRKINIVTCFVLLMLLCVTNNVKAATRIDDSQIYYVNATLTKFNPESYNAMIRGMSSGEYWGLSYDQRKAVDEQYMLFGGTGVPGVSTACVYNPPNQNAGSLTQGLASEYLVNNNLWISRFNNGATFFPTEDIVNANPGVYTEVLRNWKFPFQRSSDGYYSFDSRQIVVQRNYNTQRLEPYTGDHFCFYPFSDLSADCSDVYQRAYYYSMRLDLTYTMTDDGKVNGQDMVFNFSGDDDVWIYIDGRLAVDLGGCHPISTGNLNLATNSVYYGDSNNFSAKTVYNVLNDSQKAPGQHTMTIFYMDRADGEANLVANFNLQSGGVKVNHVDKATGNVLQTETKTTTYGNTLTTSAKTISGYTLVQKPSTETYTIHENLETVTYYYAKNSQVNVKYLDVNTGKQLFDTVVISGYEGKSYTTEQKSLNGYYVSKIQGNATGTMSSSATDVIYYYDLVRVNVNLSKLLQATDSTAAQKLAGAKFKAEVVSFADKVSVANPSTTYYSTVTDANGNCQITGLPYGTYKITEVTIPANAYGGNFTVGTSQSIVNSFTVEINKNQTYSYSLTDIAKKIQIKIFKEDKETGKTTQGDARLEGAQYTIYRDQACTNAVETLTIAKNADGTYSATSGWYLVGTYYVKETKAPTGYLIDTTVYKVSQSASAQTSEKTTHTLTLKDQVIKNDIEITKKIDKTDSTSKQNLAGAVFSATLKSNTSKVYYSTTTDANGNCKITNLPYGTYIVKETTIPATAYKGEFYVGNSTTRQTTFEQFVQVNKNSNSTYKYEITDVPKKIQIKIFKEDKETGKITQGDAHLEGAQYTIYRDKACTSAVETLTIAKNADGTYSATSGWYLVGTYYVKETKAPVGYLIDETVYTVSQNPATQTNEKTTLTLTLKDQVIKNDIEITKKLQETDSTEEQKLAGAVFSATLNSDPSKVYYSTTTDASGNCKITNLPYGTYTLKESTIPDVAYNGEFYIGEFTVRQTTFEQFVQVDKNSNLAYEYELTNVAKKMQITIYKEDIETGRITQGDAHLEGAQYTIYKDQTCTNAVETLTIAKNADGTYSATSGWYLVGTYYVKETKAPEGYLLDEKTYQVAQNPATQTSEKTSHTLTLKDQVIKNDIEIVKNLEATDSTEKQSLAGAIFSATLDSDISKVYYSSVTDENGYCIITNLPYGTYTIKESTIPPTAYNGEFYVGNSTTRVKDFKQFIELDHSTNDPYMWSDITDVAEKMQITIFKEDIETGIITQGDARLEDAEYTLYRDEDCTDPIETLTIAKNPDGTYSATSSWYLVGTYYIKETKVSEGYLIDETMYEVAQNPAAQTEEHSYHSITSKNEVIRNDIEVIKNLEATDSTEKQSLPGAVFSATLNSDTSKVYYSSVTDENGYCIITELPYGTYTLRESTLPDVAYNREFYVGDSTTRVTTFEQFVEIDNSTNDPYVWSDITDVAEKMQITIFKEDIETGIITQGDARLEDAEYTLYRDEDCTDPIETLTIAKNPDGTYSATSSWYLVGTYYIKETKVSEGYLIDETVYEVAQEPAAQTEEHSYHSITSKNEVIRNDIEVIKNLEATDSTEKQSLPGAVFSATLNSDTSKVYYSSVTDENGYCIITELPYGTYTLRESTLPDVAYNKEFYVGDSTTRVTTFEQFVEIDNSTNDPYVWGDITDVAEKMQITIYKEDLEKGNNLQGDATLEGAEYTLYRDEACTDPIETITIAKDEDGRFSAKSGWYLVGTYWMKETKAPEGYLIDEEVYKVSQDPAAQTEEHTYHSITSKDQVMKGLVHVIKYNNNSESTDKIPAEGATLMLYLNSNPDKYYLATVDENGYAEFIDEDYRDSQYPYTIPYGNYTIAEVKPSNTGKHIFINKQQTSIEYHQHTQKYILDDEFVTLRLTIEKYDAETNKKLAAGATFKIWDANANCWYSEMVYPSGEFISEFTTNDQGQLTINRHLEAGAYVLYEVTAPEGYVVDEEGYPFFIGVGQNGEVVADHNGEQKTLDYETIKYDNIPTKMYKYTVEYKNIPQKAVVEVTKLASQPVRSEKSETEYGDLYTPIFEEKGLEGVTFRLVAAEDVTTPEGTVRYTKDQIVSTFETNSEGIATSDKVYLGKYILEEISTVNGYVLDRTPVDVNIEYTTQDEEVQTIKIEKTNEKQEVNVFFEKEYIDLEQSRFKFTDRKAIFGIYGAFELIDENGEYIIMPGELVDIVEVNDNGLFENNVELPEGEYYVKELYVSNPYGKTDKAFDFEVEYTNTNDKAINIFVNDGVIENEANTAILGMFKFSDLDYINLDIENITDLDEIKELASMYGIAGATYKVYNDAECTDPVITIDDTEAEFTTDENGTIYIEDMPWGTYYFKESVSPFGYELNEEVIKVEINEDNADNVIVKKISDRLVRAELLEKRDTFTKDVIANCVFEITDERENVIYTGVTDEKGIVEIPVIYFENEGTYYYQEISAPDMYQVNEEKQEFIASYDEETCEWTLELIEVGNNRKTIDEFILVKTDRETGEPLEGCKFTIVLLDSEGKEYVNEYGETIYLVKDAITAENGEYVIENVPYGTYKFVEITPPEGYELDEDVTGYTFTIDENSGDTVIYEVTNTGDIAVYALFGILGVSILGIIYTISKRRSVNG